MTKSNFKRFIGLFILIGAIIGGSSIGTLANFIPVRTSFAKNAWRSGIVAFMFLIPAIVEYFYKRKEISYSSLITLKQYGFLLLTLICQVLWCFGLIYASLNTIQSQAYVFNNVHGLYIVMISYFLGVIPNRLEWFGVIAALIGCALMIFDPSAGRSNNEIETSIWPGMIDLGSAFFGALYFLMSA